MAGHERRTTSDRKADPDRLMPFDLPTEQGLIGAVLLNNRAYDLVADLIEAEYFFEPLHRSIWEVMSELISVNIVATPVTVRPYLPEIIGTNVNPLAYLAHLVTEATPVLNAPSHAKILRELWIRRRLIGVCQSVEEGAFNVSFSEPVEGLIGEIESEVEGLRLRGPNGRDYIRLSHVSTRVMEELASLMRHEESFSALSTGFPAIDEQINKLQKTDLILIGGRPGSGKTVLGANIALNVARQLQAKRDAGERTGIVAFQSLEMKSDQICKRMIADMANVPFFVVRRALFDEAQWNRARDAKEEIDALPFEIDDTGGLTLADIRTKARRLKKQHGLELLVVDYLQLIATPPRDKRSRHEIVTEISQGLKNLAKELEIPVIALAQLSRGVDYRDDKRPVLADLRESGSLEQDADIIMMVYREEYYLRKQEPKEGTDAHLKWQHDMWSCRGMADLNIAKNRQGADITLRMGFDGSYVRFLQEPPEREIEPTADDKYERTKPMRLSARDLSALGELRSLEMSQAVPNRDLAGVPRMARPVPYLLWREKLISLFLDCEATEKAKQDLMRDICKALIAPGAGHHPLIGRNADKERPLVWLTEAGR